MPTSIAITIARHLGADPLETERVLDALVRDIRHDVARDGHAAVPGLGTFRFFDGTIVFEPDEALALAVNHKYAGLEPLLVSGTDIRYSPATVTQEEAITGATPAFGAGTTTRDAQTPHPESGDTPPIAEEHQSETPDAAPLDASAPLWPESPDGGISAEDEDTAPPPEYTEIVPTGFDPLTQEALPHEQETDTAATEPEPLEPEFLSTTPQPDTEEKAPDLMADMPPHIPAVPAFDGGDEVLQAEEQDVNEEPADSTHQDEGVETRGQEEIEVHIGYEDFPIPAPDLSASPFFEPWPEDLPDFSAAPAPGIYTEPEKEPQTSEETDSSHWHKIDPAPAHDQPVEASEAPSETPEAATEPENPAEQADTAEPSASHQPESTGTGIYPDVPAAAYTDPDDIMPGVVPPVVESTPESEPEPVATSANESDWTEHVSEEPEQKRSFTPWLIAAVVVLGAAMALVFSTSRPDSTPPPTPIAQNDPPPTLPADTSVTSAAAADSVGLPATPPEPVAEPGVSAATQPTENESPLRRSGGIDVNAGGLTLIVASTPSRTSAEAVAERFRQLGYTTAVFYGPYGGVTRYRVGVGQFTDQQAAETQLEDLPDGFPDDAWPMPIRSEMEIYQ